MSRSGEGTSLSREQDVARDRFPRRHEVVEHTADVGLRAAAPSGEALFEEAAAGLAELGADIADPSSPESEVIELDAPDLEALTVRWLNDLIGLTEIRGEALVRTEVSALKPADHGWRLRARAWFAPYQPAHVVPRIQVKAATLHGLRVSRGPQGWELEVYLDV